MLQGFLYVIRYKINSNISGNFKVLSAKKIVASSGKSEYNKN